MSDVIQAFWHGAELSNVERLCLRSFLQHGHSVHLYCYSAPRFVPAGVVLKDASEILPADAILTYASGPGRGSYSAFSNLFRYALLHQRGGWWIDTDVICLRPFDFEENRVFAAELHSHTTRINGHVIKAPAGSDVMAHCLSEVEKSDKTAVQWGDLGPLLLTRAVRHFGLEQSAKPPEVFSPIGWNDFRRPFASASFDPGDSAHALHLFTEMLRRAGIDKNSQFAPTSLFEELKQRYLSDAERVPTPLGNRLRRRLLTGARRRRRHLLFVSSGGMGSSHLVRSIRSTGIPCVEKPFTNAFFGADWPEAVRREQARPLVTSLREPPSEELCKSFGKMQDQYAGFPEHYRLHPTLSLESSLLDYLRFLAARRVACCLRGTAARGLLAAHDFRDAVFLVRHPLEAYASYCKPERHGKDIEALGGPESDAAIDFWAWSWNSLVEEYLACRERQLDPVLVRYEFISRDVGATGPRELRRVLASFSPRRTESPLSARARQQLRERVDPCYARIYPEWDLPPRAAAPG